ncbi:MAG: hypothetical protein JWN40_3841 [Phycisphaerales bacterium]|nr:hypothetical protein [Phycisphaerales bacterium]
MRRRLHILALLPALLAAAMWARSYWSCDIAGNGTWAVMSELGAVFVGHGDVSDGFSTTPSGANGILEDETGTVRRRWLPIWTWTYKGDRVVMMQWWTITAGGAGFAWWVWRRRRDATRGFEVGKRHKIKMT